jgi:hypothetical protein
MKAKKTGKQPNTAEHTELLSRARGLLDALLWLPTSRHVEDMKLERVEGWKAWYKRHGLTIGRVHEDGPPLRELVKMGLLAATGGKTKANAHRLTWKGLLATLPQGTELTAEIVHAYLLRVSVMKKAGGYVLGSEFCKNAVKGLTSAKYEKLYFEEVTPLYGPLGVLEAMGWITMHTCSRGIVWAVKLTEAGALAVDSPPSLSPPVATMFDFDSWEEAWSEGLARWQNTPPPSQVSNIITRRLSASAWE